MVFQWPFSGLSVVSQRSLRGLSAVSQLSLCIQLFLIKQSEPKILRLVSKQSTIRNIIHYLYVLLPLQKVIFQGVFQMLEHIRTEHDLDYIMITGDYPAHDVWLQSR